MSWIMRLQSPQDKRFAKKMILAGFTLLVILLSILYAYCIIGGKNVVGDNIWTPLGQKQYFLHFIRITLLLPTALVLYGISIFAEDIEVAKAISSKQSMIINPLSGFLSIFAGVGIITWLVFIIRYLYLLAAIAMNAITCPPYSILNLSENDFELVWEGDFTSNGNLFWAKLGDPQKLELWDVKTMKQLKTLTSPIEKGYVLLWPISEEERLITKRYKYESNLSPDRKMFIEVMKDQSIDKELVVRDSESGKRLWALNIDNSIDPLGFSPDSRIVALLVFTYYEKEVRLYNSRFGGEIGHLEGTVQPTSLFSFSPDGRTIAGIESTDYGKQKLEITLWGIDTGKKLRTLHHVDRDYNYACSINRVWFSPKGKFVVTEGSHHSGYCFDIPSVKIWDVKSGDLIQTFDFDTDIVEAFSPDEKFLAIGNYDTLSLWEIGKETKKFRMRLPMSIEFIYFSPDGAVLAVMSSYPPRLLFVDLKGLEDMVAK